MLINNFSKFILEAGTDEAGRGCLAGPVTAAAVILPEGFCNELLNDSKQLTEKNRNELRTIIETEAVAFSVVHICHLEIDKINILNASIKAMQEAVLNLAPTPEYLIVDGNRFKDIKNIPYTCIIKGDSKYMSIAAASILAKTYRDDFMQNLHLEYPMYDWHNNKGYPTRKHRDAIRKHGSTSYHRQSFKLLPDEVEQQLLNYKAFKNGFGLGRQKHSGSEK